MYSMKAMKVTSSVVNVLGWAVLMLMHGSIRVSIRVFLCQGLGCLCVVLRPWGRCFSWAWSAGAQQGAMQQWWQGCFCT